MGTSLTLVLGNFGCFVMVLASGRRCHSGGQMGRVNGASPVTERRGNGWFCTLMPEEHRCTAATSTQLCAGGCKPRIYWFYFSVCVAHRIEERISITYLQPNKSNFPLHTSWGVTLQALVASPAGSQLGWGYRQVSAGSSISVRLHGAVPAALSCASSGGEGRGRGSPPPSTSCGSVGATWLHRLGPRATRRRW